MRREHRDEAPRTQGSLRVSQAKSECSLYRLTREPHLRKPVSRRYITCSTALRVNWTRAVTAMRKRVGGMRGCLGSSAEGLRNSDLGIAQSVRRGLLYPRLWKFRSKESLKNCSERPHWPVNARSMARRNRDTLQDMISNSSASLPSS